MHISIMNPLRILLLAALILTASFPGCLDKDSTGSEEINKPVAKIVSINPVNLTIGETVSFTGEGTTDEGYIIGYDWGSSLDGFLSDEKIFSISNLSIGNHTIFFKVQNDDKIWSDRAELNLTVNEVPEAPEVPNRPPEASILMPTQASSFNVGERVVIDCIASDPDGDLLEYLWILYGLEEAINLTTEKSAEVEFSTTGNDLVLKLIVTDTEGLTSEDIVASTTGKKQKVGYNWPYDFFSLVELIKLDAGVELGNIDRENSISLDQVLLKPVSPTSEE